MELLNDIEVRVLGCLIEKGITTPDYYPLTLNAVTNACNQKSNRDPVVSYEDTTVVRGLDGLQDKGLSEKIYKADSRVPKYQNVFAGKLDLSRQEVAVICVLMLRGPQTTGEIRGRAERMFKFGSLNEVEEVLNGLMEKEAPMAVKLPRQPGRKERRYMHLLAGEPDFEELKGAAPDEAATIQVRSENERMEKLETELSELHTEFDRLKKEFNDLRSQFE